MRQLNKGWWVVAAGTVLTAGMSVATAYAAVQLDRTRVIVNQQDNKQSIRASNRGKAPVLLQIWMEAGEAEKQANTAKTGLTIADTVSVQSVPFIIDPPVVRLKPDETRALQVWLTRPPETLPKDRESQFWLNVLEVPAVAMNGNDRQQNASRLDISIITRIKVFYRPEAIAEHKWSEKDWLQFKLEKDEQNQNWLIIDNPAPIHRSFTKLALHPSEGENPVDLDGFMIAPFSQQEIQLPESLSKTGNLKVNATSLDDRGVSVKTDHLL